MKLHTKSLVKIGAAFCVLLLSLTLAMGTTQARYNNATSWSGVYQPEIGKVTSDLLTGEGQTVVLQPWEAVPGTTRTESIQLFSSKGSAAVTAQCSSNSSYVTAQLEQSTVNVTEAGTALNVKLTVADTAGQITEITDVKISVTVNNPDQSVLKADYQVKLIPEGMSLGDPEEGSLQDNLTVVPNQSVRTFAWKEKLVFSLTARENADSIQLLYDGGAFPKGTRYTVDSVQYVLGDGMTIQIPVTPGTKKAISLDFSQTGDAPTQAVSITARACLGNLVTGQIDFSARATRAALEFGEMDADPVLNGSGSIAIPISGDTEGLIILAQHLSKTNTGTIYVDADHLATEVYPDQENDGRYLIEISNDSGKASAGTYRLTLIRMCEEQVVSTLQMYFFLHY